MFESTIYHPQSTLELLLNLLSQFKVQFSSVSVSVSVHSLSLFFSLCLSLVHILKHIVTSYCALYTVYCTRYTFIWHFVCLLFHLPKKLKWTACGQPRDSRFKRFKTQNSRDYDYDFENRCEFVLFVSLKFKLKDFRF